MLSDYFVQGLLHISDLGADYFRFERSQQCLIGDRNGQRFSLGDPIQVLVAGVEPAQGKIDLRRVRQGGGKESASKIKNNRRGGGKRSGRRR
mgnify:FL=1